ncbi:ankyrin repeat, PH and SEC7 domain containing protein secG-like [Chenopodium quinoa]|uniref:ankyrin repeat, PH and SEC7 domain containing protein secG-like n=1 Tax=Chenopodium quinoa TaxID=63459 RepID=UPI000B78B144|nr:ankyrin repeat, PH and SEC7 domain containing protein secG-like [Chenopodium quinoa]
MDRYGKQEAKQLMRANEMLRAKDEKGRSVLHIAAAGGDTTLCRFFLKTVKFDVNVTDIKGHTPLHYAIAEGQNFMASSFLLNQGANPNLASDAGMTPLYFAAVKGQKDQMKLLVSKGAKVDAPSLIKGTPLRFAAEYGVKEGVKFLLDNKANPNSTIHPVHPPLVMAIARKSVDCVRLLLKGGADPNLSLQGESPLTMAVLVDDAEIIKCLLKAGANANAIDFYDFTPIELAAKAGKVALINILFKATARIPHIPNWSCQGILEYTNSKEAIEKRLSKVESKFVGARDKGTQAFKASDYLSAIYWFTEAITTFPLEPSVYVERSLCWMCINDGKRALKDAEECIKLEPEFWMGHYRSGEAHRMLQDYDKAKEAFKTAMKFCPENKKLEDTYREVILEEAMPIHDRGQPVDDYDLRLF